MCKLDHNVPSPLQQSGVPDVGSGMNAGPDNPETGAPQPTQTAPTKFAKLLKVMIPLATGAGVGATSGNWRVPGSGSQAAQNFFAQQTAQKMQQQDLALRRQQDTTLNQQRIAQTQLDQQRTSALERGNNKSETRPEPVNGVDHDFRYTYDASGNVVNKVDLGQSKLAAAPRGETDLTTDAAGQRVLVDKGTGQGTPVTEPGGIPMEPEQSPVIPGMQETQPTQPRVPVIAPPTAGAEETKIVPRMMGGRAHNILINARSGEDIKDEGEAPPTTAELNAAQTPGGGAGTGGGAEGPAFLAAIKDPGYRNMVRQIGDYQEKMPGLGMMGSGARMKLLQDIHAYKPDYDETQFAARNKTRSDFAAGGATGKKITSLNTAIAHMGTLAQAADALDNSSLPLWNAVSNKTSEWAGHPQVGNFNTAATAVTSELGNAFRATGLSEKDIDSWKSNFSKNMSPKQFQGAIQTTIKLLRGRLDEMNDRWEATMGTPKDFHFLSPDAAQTLHSIGGNDADDLLEFDGYDPKNLSAGPEQRTNTGQLIPRGAQGGFSQGADGVWVEQ